MFDLGNTCTQDRKECPGKDMQPSEENAERPATTTIVEISFRKAPLVKFVISRAWVHPVKSLRGKPSASFYSSIRNTRWQIRPKACSSFLAPYPRLQHLLIRGIHFPAVPASEEEGNCVGACMRNGTLLISAFESVHVWRVDFESGFSAFTIESVFCLVLR